MLPAILQIVLAAPLTIAPTAVENRAGRYIRTSKQMSRLTSVLTMFLAFLAGNAIGLPAELATHSAKVNATNRVALDQVRGSIETNEANNGTVPATVSVGGVRCSPLKTPTACTPLVRVSAHALTAAISRHARIAHAPRCSSAQWVRRSRLTTFTARACRWCASRCMR